MAFRHVDDRQKVKLSIRMGKKRDSTDFECGARN